MRPKTNLPPRAEAKVLFHDRRTMEDAVHSLVDAGVRPTNIRVEQGMKEDDRFAPAPEHDRAVLPGLGLGAVVGGIVAALSVLALRTAGFQDVPLAWIAVRVLSGIAGGALLGALLALVFQELTRGGGHAASTPTGDFLVCVKTPSERAGADVRALLVHSGGAPVPA